MRQEDFMQIALAEAKQGDSPYGAVIVKDNKVIVKGHNTVNRDNDPSAHAELNVIRQLTTKIKSLTLEGYTIYSTAEPCPMCATACVFAGIAEIIFAASISDLIELNQAKINISCEEVIAKGYKKIKVQKGLMKTESLALFNR